MCIRDRAKGGAEADAVDVQNTNNSGRVRFPNLRFAQTAQTFYVRELAAPAGYDVNTEIYEITVAYSRDQTEFTFEKDGGVLYNDKLGTVTIHKQGSWQGIDDTAQVSVDLSGVTFSLYKVENCGDVHSADAQEMCIRDRKYADFECFSNVLDIRGQPPIFGKIILVDRH